MLVKLKQKFIESTVWKKFKTVLSFCFAYLHKKFLWGIFSFIPERFFKFLFVGVLNTLFSYTIYALFVSFGLGANLSLFLQYIIGVLWNFKTTGVIVFKSSNNRLLLRFVLCYVFTFVLNSVSLRFLLNYTNEYIAQAILVLPVAIVSFLLLKVFVFKN